MLAKVQSGAVLGIDAYIVKVELDISEGLPVFNTVGLPDVAIKEARGIKEKPVKKADSSTSELKAQIKSLKAQRQAALEAKDKKMATIFKRRISRLKKKTRRKAA